VLHCYTAVGKKLSFSPSTNSDWLGNIPGEHFAVLRCSLPEAKSRFRFLKDYSLLITASLKFIQALQPPRQREFFSRALTFMEKKICGAYSNIVEFFAGICYARDARKWYGDVAMRIYMDVCCLNRPFDDLSQDRVYLEAEAVLSIVSHCEKGEWHLMKSSTIDYELLKISEADRFEQVQELYAAASERIKLTEQAEKRAVFFQQNGLKPIDSLHLASAEASEVDIFLTTDDRLLRAANKMNLKIKIVNPVSWLMEVMNNE
jgi:predicted nucleic acid-binding protein